MKITPMVQQLLIITVVAFFGVNLIGNAAANYQLLSLYHFENPNFRFWQPLTHVFMHAPLPDLSHIMFNMFGLYSFGSALEHFWGGKKFLFFYISCGLGAALVHSLVNFYEVQQALNAVANLGLSKSETSFFLNADFSSFFDANNQFINQKAAAILEKSHCNQTQFNLLNQAANNFQSTAVGASGAIYGIIVAFAFMFPNAELALLFVPIPIKAKYFVPILVGFDLFSGVTGFSIFGGGNIAHFAHVGGALFGLLIMWVWKSPLKPNHHF